MRRRCASCKKITDELCNCRHTIYKLKKTYCEQCHDKHHHDFTFPEGKAIAHYPIDESAITSTASTSVEDMLDKIDKDFGSMETSLNVP